MIGSAVKASVTVVVYGVLLAIGFRIGQKTCEYVESGKAKEDLTKLTNKVKEKYNDSSRSACSSQEIRN